MSQHTHLPILAAQRAKGRVALSVICDIQHDRASSAKERFAFAEQSADAFSVIARDDIDAVYIFGMARAASIYLSRSQLRRRMRKPFG